VKTLWKCDDGTYDICEDGEVIEQNVPVSLLTAAPLLVGALQDASRVLAPTDPSKFSAKDERRRIATAQTVISAALAAAGVIERR
jgi:hypothetical protein